MKNRKRILAAVLTAIMTISMLPASTLASEPAENEAVESAEQAVSMPEEEQEVEAPAEDISEEKAEEADVVSSDTVQTEETADPAVEEAEEVTEAVDTAVQEEAEEAITDAAAEDIAEPAETAGEEAAAEDTVEWPITLQAKGTDYIVTVTFDENAGLPADARISVEEILANDKAYDGYVEQAADKIDADVENLSYVRLFDISLVGADGGKLEPTGPVDVKIRLKDVEKADETTQVVHFAGEKEIPEIIDTEIKGKDVSFETDSFSIYAVVVDGEHSSEDRLEVTFNLNNGSINGSTANIVILVKQDDITDNNGNEFNKIVYDPGMPEATGKKFMGWTTEENYDDETTPMTIDQVRDDIKNKLATVKEGDKVTYYAMMFNAFELYYVNENNVLFNTVSLLSTEDSVTTEVKQEYSVSGSATEGFIGWVEQGEEQPVYKVGQQIIITTAQPQVVLTPKLGPGKWLYFDGNDGGSTAADTASYTPPAFVPENASAMDYKPADPTRAGYTFGGWYTEAEGGTEFFVGQPTLSVDTTVYAHWTPNPDAQYTVIVWAQSVDDNWEAEDADKTYDYVDSQKFTVATGTQITEELLSQGGFLSKADSYFGVTDLKNGSKAFQYRTFEVKNGVGSGKDEVSAMGDTVVNVYYDRKIMTIEFAGAADGTSQTYYEPVDSIEGTEAYGLIGGEYVLLETVVEKYIEWHSSYNATEINNVGELTSIYWKSSGDYISVSTANIDLTSAEIEKVYPRIQQSGTKYTLYGGSSDSTNMYRTAATTNKLYALIKARDPHYYYNGVEYTGQIYAKRTGNVLVYTGLYGQPMSKYGYKWPKTDASHQWRSISYIGSFNGSLFGHSNLGGSANKISTSQLSATQNTTIIYYMQSTEDENSYTEVARSTYSIASDSGFMITERFLGSEPSGYRWTTSSTIPTTWPSEIEVDNRGYTTETRGNNSYLHVKYDRVKNDIVFMLGSDRVDTIEDIPYGKNLSKYKDYAPGAPEVGENEYFYGWYEDPEGVKEVDWSENMPLANKVIYGITGPVQYHVIIEMNAGGDTVDFGGATQSTEFYLDYGETISGANLMRATRTDYSVIGYYTEDAVDGQFDSSKLWNFDAQITEQSLWHKYTGPDDPYRLPANHGGRKSDVGWDSTVGIFKIYARWRDDSLINSGGIHIKYVSEGTAIAEDQDPYDPYGYADGATVIVGTKPDESLWPEGKRFTGWKLGDVVYLPGQTFTAAKDAAQLEGGKYYMTLTAEYADIEEKTPTHIVWYMNDGTGVIYATSPKLDINEATDIPAAPSRGDGYRFLGWAKDVEKQSATGQPNTSTEITEPNFLKYNNGKYYTVDNKEVTQVAADEMLPYEALYAIWSPVCKVYHSASDTMVTVDITKGGTIDLVSMVPSNKLYGGYYEYVADSDTHKGAAIMDVSGRNVTPYKSTDTKYEGVTYYLKEVDAGYLKPQVYLVWNTNHDNLIVDLYGFVDIDVDEDYSDCGLMMVDPDDHKTVRYTIPTEDALASEFIVTKNGEQYKDPLTISSLFGMSSGVVGMAYLSDYIEAEATLEIRGYYVTLDGITVTGFKDRMVQFGPGNGHNGMPTHNEWNVAGSTQSGLYTAGKTESKAASLNSSRPMTAQRVLTVNAPADEKEYTITKVYDSGTEDQTVEGGDQTGEIAYATRDGYMFAGWYQDEAFTTPADFSEVSSDMTVYAKYISSKDISVGFTRKYWTSSITAFNTTVSVKGQDALQNVSITVNGSDSAVLGTKSVKKSGSGKNVKYVTSYRGLLKVKGLSLTDTFTAAVSWVTPDGTAVTGSPITYSYVLGIVKVQ